jgi:hypothetical protein
VASAEGTLEALAQALAQRLEPLEDRVVGDDLITLLAELGLQFPGAVANDPGLSAAASATVIQIEQIPDLASALATAIGGGDTGRILSAGLALAKAILGVVQGIEGLGSALKAAGAGAGIPPAELNQFADELAIRLVDYLAIIQLEAVHLAPGLDLIGFVESTSVPATDAAHPAFVRRRLHFDQLLDFITNPGGHLRAGYGWGDPGFDGHALLQKLYELLTAAGAPAILDTAGPQPVLDALFFELRPKTNVAPPGLQIDLVGKLAIDNAQPFKADNWQITLVNEIDLALGTKLILLPNDTVSLQPPSGQAQGRIVLEWTGGTPDGPPYTIIGASGSSGLTAQQLIASAGLGLVWNTATNQALSELSLGAQVKGGKLNIDLSDADGFIGTILGGLNVTSDFNASLLFSTAHGLTFQGSSALEIQLPLHVSLGPVDLTALTITVGFSGASVPIGVGVDFQASLGPLQATVRQLGFTATITVPADYKGNVGPARIEFGFLPPTGVGLSIDAAVVSGGGFLSIDTARGQYAGVLQLTIADFLNVTAIGLIETKLPDGSPGFSLLIILTADFGTGIQLGFGFTLLAVGGLVGLNRGMLFQPIMDAIRTNAISSVAFPQNVVANATRIISDLQSFFPPQQGTFLIGPMAKIGWGEPTLASLSLGVIIEIPPGDIAILGIIRLALPADDVAILGSGGGRNCGWKPPTETMKSMGRLGCSSLMGTTQATHLLLRGTVRFSRPIHHDRAPAEAAAITAYWQAVWLADGDAAKVQAATDALQAAVGAARAATLIAGYKPFNLSDTPAAPLRKSDVALSSAFVEFPLDPPTKQAAWTQAPRVDLFPERFIILGYNAGALTLEAIGNVVSVPLYVGPDPSVDLQTNPDAAIHPEGDDLFVPDQLQWMTDFPRAVAAGMGIAIDLTTEQARTGFDRLLAIGLVLGAPGTDAKSALEGLFRHHAQGRSGLAIVPQGTPTHNSTGVGSGHSSIDDPDQSFDDRKSTPLFTPTADPNQKRDGQWLLNCLALIQRSSRRCTAATAPTRWRGGRCGAPCGRQRSATGWTSCSRRCLATRRSRTRDDISPSMSAAAALHPRSGLADSPMAFCPQRRFRASPG